MPGFGAVVAVEASDVEVVGADVVSATGAVVVVSVPPPPLHDAADSAATPTTAAVHRPLSHTAAKLTPGAGRRNYLHLRTCQSEPVAFTRR
jgi:hypothetical protein